MKQIFVLIFLFLSFVCEAQTEKMYKSEEVNEINGLWYSLNDSTLVTGKIVTYDGSGEKKVKETTVKEGKKEGLARQWYENGQLKVEATVKEGKPEGLGRSWYENGQLKGEGNFKDGKQIGLTKEKNKNIKVGFIYGVGTQEIFPFNSKDYNYDTQSFKAQINFILKMKRKWNFELLIEPSLYIAEHQLLNKYYVKPSDYENYLELREIYTKKKPINEYVLSLGIISRYKMFNKLSSYTLLSIGPMISNTSTERLKKGFAFSDVLAFGLSYNSNFTIFDFRFGLRHVSNANIYEVNSGHNSSFIEFGALFQL